jgi:CDGSH-type Zn-finger protein
MSERRIEAQRNGPYLVTGDVPLRGKRAIVSEHGEPLTWQTTGPVEAPETYVLCRCGRSANKPFCDGTHKEIGFRG